MFAYMVYPPAISQTGKLNDDADAIEITPNAAINVKTEEDETDIFITADFIYWTTRMDGLGFILSRFGSTTLPATRQGSLNHPNWEFDPGFKVGIGFELGYDGWDIYGQYTWLRSSNDQSVKQVDTANSPYYPTWNISNQFNNPSQGDLIKGRVQWRNRFNMIDVELGRNFYISPDLTLRHHIGFKGGWDDLDYRVFYLQSSLMREKMRQNHDFWGFGIRTGLNTAWKLGWGFSIYGDFSLAALWSQFKIERKDEQQDPKVTTILTENSFHTLQNVLELALGLRWGTYLIDDGYHIMFQAGWEEQVWFNFNQMIHFYEECAHGDLIFQGLTVKARFDF